MFDLRQTNYQRIALDEFKFVPSQGRLMVCGLELLRCTKGRTLAVATELKNNPGLSITNAAERLASSVCDRFGINPALLVWVEHYGYRQAIKGEARPFVRVTFARKSLDKVAWADFVRAENADGWPVYFADPEWRVMTAGDWEELGLPPRPDVVYD